MKEPVYQILNYFKKQKKISYVKTIEAGEDINDLIQKKQNTINIELSQVSITKLPGFGSVSGEKRTYKFVVQFFTPDVIRKYAIFGFKNQKGLLDLSEDIWEVLKSDKTINGYFLPMDTSAEILTQTFKLKDGSFIAGAEMILNFSKNYFNDSSQSDSPLFL